MVRTYSVDTYDVTYFDWNDNQLTASTVAPGTTDGLYNFFVTTDVPLETPITQNFYVSIKGGSAEIRYYFKYDNRCVINEDYLYYLDRMGSWQSFAPPSMLKRLDAIPEKPDTRCLLTGPHIRIFGVPPAVHTF